MRRAYLDWMRGLSVVFMIEAHTFDAWTRAADRASTAWFLVQFVGGLAAPAFLLLAGVSVVLAGSSRERRLGDRRRASWSVQKRGWQIFGLAFLFRLQSYVLSLGTASFRSLLRADILNIMGPSIAAAAWLWGRVSNRRARLVIFGLLACALGYLTPVVRAASWLSWLPDPLEWYVRPIPRMSVFTFFPWMGYVFAGAFIGEVLAAARTPAREWRTNRILFASGAGLVLAGYAGAHLPSLYPPGQSDFWTSSPTYYFIKIGIVLMLTGAVYLYVQRPLSTEPRTPQWSPMLEFGRSSLFVYWIHVELAYGYFSYPLHRRLPLAWTCLAFVAFTALMYWATAMKNRLASGAAQAAGVPQQEAG